MASEEYGTIATLDNEAGSNAVTELENTETVHVDSDGNRVVPASAIRKPPVPNPTIKLADGSAYKGSAAINSTTGDLWIWLEADQGYTMAGMFPVFNDPSKTGHIETTYLDTDTPTVYDGYTIMNIIKQDPNGQISVRLVHE